MSTSSTASTATLSYSSPSAPSSSSPSPSSSPRSLKPTESKSTKALLLSTPSGPYNLTTSWPRPIPSPNEILIKNHVAALNPMDWKSVEYGFGIFGSPWINGREGAGVIEEVGEEVKTTGPGEVWKRGDRVLVTSTRYRDIRTATFQEYIVAYPHNICRIPDWMSFTSAATLGVGTVAAAAALFDGLGLEIPKHPSPAFETATEESENEGSSKRDQPRGLLIWGASSTTGQQAIQLAKHAGLHVAAVASEENKAYLLSLGVDVFFGRHQDHDAIVSEARNLGFDLAIDCVGAETAAYAAQAVGSEGRLVCLVKRPAATVVEPFRDGAARGDGRGEKPGVEVREVAIKPFHEDSEYGFALMAYLSHALHSGVIRPLRYEIVAGGLGGVEEGLRRLRDGEGGGRKLVVVLDETVTDL
ncbi:MAG: hypothetical protein M1819_001688 [Sarea resinae]|nr:MAG: hypothetical protein M1819_001688 [Sarea resinae]